MEEKAKKCQKVIIGLIDKYGKEKFAAAMMKYYGCRSLLDRGELLDLEELIMEDEK